MLTVKKSTYQPSTNFPKLTFWSSLSKDRLSDGSRVATMLSHLTSTHEFRQGLSSGLEWTMLTQDTHFTFHHGAYSYHLGLGQLKDRIVKSSTVLLALWSTITLEFLQDFRIKLKVSLYDTFQSLICGIFGSSPRQVSMPALRICGICRTKA